MKKLFIAIFFVSLIVQVKAQQKEVLMTIDGHQITKDEFVRIYKKNNEQSQIDKKTVEEYLELFVNFKLKVIEAQNRGLDTSIAFQKEFNSYRKQLAQPYLTDDDIVDSLVVEAYERSKTEIHASHILVKVPPEASPEDTLKAYNKLLEIRENLIKNNNFDEKANELTEATKNNNSNKQLEIMGGDLGYFTVFKMVYPFESAAYNTEVNQISMPFRTQFGYHIVYVKDKRPAKGTVKVAHLMLVAPQDADNDKLKEIKDKIFDLHSQIENGADFAKLAEEHSDDRNSARKGGELAWFGTGEMIKEFEDIAFSLEKKGDISKPLKTFYGWHIIKLIDKKQPGTYEEVKSEFKMKVAKDSRAQISQQIVIKRLKNEYNFTQLSEINEFYAVLDSTVFDAKWNAQDAKHLTKPLFKIGKQTVNQQDFVKYIANSHRRTKPIPIKIYVDNTYKKFVNEKVLEYEENHLEEKYDDFKYLLQEYHDGILLFEITDQMVWTKAVKDTVGLKEFYEKNKQNYQWEPRYSIDIFYCNNAKTAKKIKKKISKTSAENYDKEKIITKYNKKREQVKVQSEIVLKDDEKCKNISVEKRLSENTEENGKIKFSYLKKELKEQAKKLEEIQGVITSEYQEHLEKEWINELKNKYPVKINQDVLSSIK